MAGKRCSGRLRFEKDRSRAEAMRLSGATFMELGKAYGISHSLVAKIFKEWGHEPAFKYRDPEPPPRLPAFRPGEKYRVDGRAFRHLETIPCERGALYRFRSPAGWEESFTAAQLLGVEVVEL